MPPALNLTGQKFGRLTALRRVGTDKDGKAVWACICSCGRQSFVRAHSLKRGNTTSCGLRGRGQAARSRARAIRANLVQRGKRARIRRQRWHSKQGETRFKITSRLPSA